MKLSEQVIQYLNENNIFFTRNIDWIFIYRNEYTLILTFGTLGSRYRISEFINYTNFVDKELTVENYKQVIQDFIKHDKVTD